MHSFVCDECVPQSIIQYLSKSWYEVFSIKDKVPWSTDEKVFEIVKENNAILITADRDFGKMIFLSPLADYRSIGFMYLREIAFIEKMKKMIYLVLQKYNSLHGLFVTITTKKVRIRHIC